MNKVILVGRLARDPELRTTGSGKSVATFSLAADLPVPRQRPTNCSDWAITVPIL